MAYKTKAEKRAFKAGLFAGLKGKKRKRKVRSSDSQKRSLETYAFWDKYGLGIDVKGRSFDDAARNAKKQYKEHYGWDLDLYKAVRKSDSAVKFYR